MEKDTRTTRVRNIQPDNDRSATSRSSRVAPSMRSGSARVRTVDMSSVETPTRQSKPAADSRRSPSSVSRRSPSASVSRSTRSSASGAQRTASSRVSSRTSAETVSKRPSSERPVRSSAPASGRTASASSRSTTAGNRNYSDILAEKKSRPTDTTERRSTAPAKKKSSRKSGFAGLSKFTRFIIIYAAIFVVIILVVAIILSSYLRKYENGQPSHVAESVVEQFSSTSKLKSFLEKNASIVKSNEGILDFDDYYYSMIEGKDISFVADSGKTTTELSVYRINADGSNVAEIELTKTGSDSWTLTSIDTTAAFSDIRAYSVLVPDGSKVVVNGIELSNDCITGTGIPEILEYSSQFIQSKPEFTTYTVKLASGGVPSVSGTDASGQNLVFTQTDKLFVAGGGASQDFIDGVKDRVETGVREYALYFEYLAHDLADYMLPDCERYYSIFGKEGVIDPINPWLYNWDYINDWEFREISAKNYTVYSSDCFTVDVNYDLYITFNEDGPYGHIDGLDEDNPVMDATWVWVKDANGTWMICDIVDHY